MRRTQRGAPLFFPITLVLVGIVILLNNFLLINADIVSLWPALLILIGLQLIWRGDLAPSWQAHTFGITRGSVESASLEVSSAEIDVRVRPLAQAGRLISGQYTARSRPRLAVRNNHASLVMRRGDTWLFSWADWDLRLAQDLPWSLLISAHLGEISADLRGITLTRGYIASGIGNIKVVCPEQTGGMLYVNSTFGDIQVTALRHVPMLLRVKASPMVRVVTGEYPFEVDAGRKFYATPAYDPQRPALEVTISATFGNIVLTLVD